MISEIKILGAKIQTYLYPLIAMFIAFLTPINPLVFLIGVAIILDTISGIYRAYHQKKSITSRALSEIIKKMVIYQLAIILLYCVDYYIMNEFLKLFVNIDYVSTKFAAFILIGIETLSVLENLKLSGIDLVAKSKNFLRRSGEVKKEVVDLFDIEKESDPEI